MVGSQARIFIGLILSSVFIGFLSVVGLVLFLSPQPQYLVKDVLVSPKVLQGIEPDEAGASKGMVMAFDSIEFNYFDSQTIGRVSLPLSVQEYNQFFSLFSTVPSVENVSNEILGLFERHDITSLSLNVNSFGGAFISDSKELLQEVQFSNKGDYFRVELQSHDGAYFEKQWAYFFFPNINWRVKQCFNSQVGKFAS